MLEVKLFVTGVKMKSSGVTAVLHAHTDKITLYWHINILLLLLIFLLALCMSFTLLKKRFMYY